MIGLFEKIEDDYVGVGKKVEKQKKVRGGEGIRKKMWKR